MERFDVAVIGGGLLGCFAARELSRLKLEIVLLEAREDVCAGVSRANTAIVYSGCDHKPGTRKAEMAVRANASFDRLCEELDVPFSRCGSLMLSFGPRADAALQKKLRQGRENGVPGLRLLSADEAYRMEPAIAPGLSSALYAPTTGTVNPWQLGIAACENAVQNGVQLRLNTRVLAMRRENSGYLLETDRGVLQVRAVVNCAGPAADRVQELLVLNRTLIGMPPVVCGLLFYMLFSGVGPFGKLHLLFTVKLMILAQVVLITPIIIGVMETFVADTAPALRETARGLGFGRMKEYRLLINECLYSIFSAYLLSFARAIAEVGAVAMVGGAIAWKTNVMTTAIMMYTNRGSFTLGVALGLILLTLSLLVNVILSLLQGRLSR